MKPGLSPIHCVMMAVSSGWGGVGQPEREAKFSTAEVKNA